MSSQPPGQRLDGSADAPVTPGQSPPAVLGWPDALRMTHDPEGSEGHPLERLEAAVAALLGRGYGVLDGAGIAVHLRLKGFPQLPEPGEAHPAAPSEHQLVIGWPSAAPAAELLRLEELADAGPGLASVRSRGPIDCGDLTATTGLWPAVTAASTGLGIRSVLAVPLVDGSDCLGSLVHYSTEIRELPALVMTAKMSALAAHISVLVANAAAMSASSRTIAQLRDAMVSRSVIEQAKGVLMARETIDADTAWQYLVRISQRTHRKLRDISNDIVAKASSGTF